MRTLMLVLLLSVTGLPVHAQASGQVLAQVINGETPYDDTMLPRQASGADDPAATSPPRGAPARERPATTEPPSSPGDRRD